MKRLIIIVLFSLVLGFFITYTSDLSSVKELLTNHPCSDCGMQIDKGWPIVYYSVYISSWPPVLGSEQGTFSYPYFFLDTLIWMILVSSFIQILLYSKLLRFGASKRFLKELLVSFVVVIVLGYWQYLELILDPRYPNFHPTLSNAPLIGIILGILILLSFLVAGLMRCIEYAARQLKL